MSLLWGKNKEKNQYYLFTNLLTNKALESKKAVIHFLYTNERKVSDHSGELSRVCLLFDNKCLWTKVWNKFSINTLMTVVYVKKHHHDLKKMQNSNIYPFDTFIQSSCIPVKYCVYIQHTTDNKIMKWKDKNKFWI